MYKCKHFKIEELVPPELFEKYKNEQYKLWWVFNHDTLYVADRLREDYGPMTCNDWLWNGERTMSGIRFLIEEDIEIGAELSQHKFGRALDLIPKNVHPDEIRKDIRNQKKPYMEKIRAIETNISWLHYDMRNNKGKLMEFPRS